MTRLEEAAGGLVKLSHYSVRTTDLEASRRFYTEVLGLRVGDRPPFDFPGLWLYPGSDASDVGVVHLIGLDPNDAAVAQYLGKREVESLGTGAFDHVAFLARGWRQLRARCEAHGLAYRERTVPAVGLHQVFIVDPSGVTIELNYPADETELGASIAESTQFERMS